MKYFKIHFILLYSLFAVSITPAQTNQETSQDSAVNAPAVMINQSENDSIRILYNLGLSHKDHSQYDNSIKALNRAVSLAKEEDDIFTLIDSYNLFAQIYIELEKFQTARLYLQNARTLLEQNEYNYGKIQYEILEGFILLKEKKYDASLERFKIAKTFNVPPNNYLANTILLYEGEALAGKNEPIKAVRIYERLLAEKDTFSRKDVRTKMLVSLARIDLEEGNVFLAEESANKAQQLAKKHRFYAQLLESYEVLGEVHEKRGLYKRAYKDLKEAQKIKDSFFNPITVLQHEAIAVENESAYKDEVIESQAGLIEAQQKTVSRSKLTSVLTSAFLIIISLLTISLYRNNQIKLKTNDLLLKKNLELQMAKEEAEKAMQAKAQFLSTVSHELRTPLYAVTGLTHLLLEENPTENQKEHLKSLKFSGDYLLAFINDILQINKIEANKVSLQKIKFSLKKMLSEVVSSLQQTAKENNNEILLNIDKSIPKQLIGDPLKLSQIFINLMGNALKFTKNGTVTVAANLIKKNEGTSLVRFEVKDTGIGISKEMKESIFESFSQGSVQINRKYGGTGLGLTIVRSMLSLFNSEIQVDSELGKGSTFYFDILLKHLPSERVLKDDTEVSDPEFEDDVLKGLHLLLVEDNKINQVITQKMLQKKGISCDIAENGYEAIDKVKKHEYHAVLMDIHMPGISGITATQEIRKFNTKLPIIALTAISIDDSTENFYSAGCNDVVTKPFKPEVFYQKIAQNIFDS